jgi:hypothetical protein
MTPSLQANDYVELRSLAERYAAGADSGDAELFLSAFHADATLAVYRDGSDPVTQYNGADEMRTVPGRLGSRYTKTFHFIGNTRYDVDGDDATGEVYCIAHHLTADGPGGTDYVMLIRYRDEYRRTEGRWGIARRHVGIHWTELRTALPSPL